MKRFQSFFNSLVTIIALAGCASLAAAAPIDELVAAARKEGVIEFLAPSTFGPQGAQSLAEAFNRKYNLNIRLSLEDGPETLTHDGVVVRYQHTHLIAHLASPCPQQVYL